MKRIPILLSFLLILTGCAHLEFPQVNTYPFRAEFTGSGTIKGMDLQVTGALYLSTEKTGKIEVYGPGGLAAYVIDLQGDRLVLKDTWGNKVDAIDLPLSDMAGLVAGDVPGGAYLYKVKIQDGVKVIYHWGKLFLDGRTLPSSVHVNSSPPFDVKFTPEGRDIILTISHGPDTARIRLFVRQGGRWLSS